MADKTALERFKACEGDQLTDPVERLRFFCSFALTGQDWLDVEPFFDALNPAATPSSEDQDMKLSFSPLEANQASAIVAALEARLIALIHEDYNPEQRQSITKATRLDALCLDSLHAVELLMAIEEEFALADMIEDSVALKAKTVGDLLNILVDEIAKGNVRPSAMPKDEQP